MRVLIISDTHTDSSEKLPQTVLQAAKEADAILHAGDIIGYKVIHDLIKINPKTYAVKGNMDPNLGELLPKKRILTLGGITIGITHGDGAPYGIENRLLYQFENVDLIVFGHTHKPFWGEIGGVHFLNPGSPTDKRHAPFHSFAWLTIENGSFDAEIVRI